MLNSPVFQVSEFIEATNHHLNLLGEVTIEGEITRLDIKNRNLIFLTIKDKSSSLDVFTMAHIVRNIHEFEPGMLVHVTGTAGLYKGSGKFRLFASVIIPHGEGSLQIAFEKLKLALEAEGLFDPSHKRTLPLWPKNIGLITAAGSSAYYDQVKIISARMGGLVLKHLPVSVQGREAIPTILAAFAYVNAHQAAFDVVILARGGGSLEDLAAFNSEEVARAVFACKVPTISAIGHEDNWSLTDYVADVRASTPSNAAEIVVRDQREVRSSLDYTLTSLKNRLLQIISLKKGDIIGQYHLIHRQIQLLSASVNQTILLLPQIKGKLTSMLSLQTQSVLSLERLLTSLDYQNVLKRGYSITRNSRQQIITSPSQIIKGESISTQLHTGIINSVIT